MTAEKSLDKIVNAFAEAYAEVENSGGRVQNICAMANIRYRGHEVPVSDAKFIAYEIAKRREWEGDTAKVRRSEIRRVLAVYSVLSPAIIAVREKAGACDWRGALRLATLLRQHDGKVRPAVAAFFGQEARRASPKSRTESVLRSWYRRAKGEQRTAILKAAALLGLRVTDPAPVVTPRAARTNGHAVEVRAQ